MSWVWVYWGFGQWKELTEWLKDRRCPEGLTYQSLYKRMKKANWDIEKVFQKPHRKKGQRYPYGGKSFTLQELVALPSCQPDQDTLRIRIQRLGWTIKKAVEHPVKPKVRMIPAFGLLLPMEEWVVHEKNKVGRRIIARIERGIDPEVAMICTEKINGIYVDFRGEHRRLASLCDEFEMPYKLVVKRYYAGIDIELALTSPSGLDEKLFEAFGEKKTLSEWARDPRCKCTYDTLWYRVNRAGMSVEVAMSLQDYLNQTYVEIYGVRRTVAAWAGSRYCKVPHRLFYERLRTGMPPELALMRENMRPQIGAILRERGLTGVVASAEIARLLEYSAKEYAKRG